MLYPFKKTFLIVNGIDKLLDDELRTTIASFFLLQRQQKLISTFKTIEILKFSKSITNHFAYFICKLYLNRSFADVFLGALLGPPLLDCIIVTMFATLKQN